MEGGHQVGSKQDLVLIDIHFEDIFPGTVLTPEEYVKGLRDSSYGF